MKRIQKRLTDFSSFSPKNNNKKINSKISEKNKNVGEKFRLFSPEINFFYDRTKWIKRFDEKKNGKNLFANKNQFQLVICLMS
jgi:hypothetical protein